MYDAAICSLSKNGGSSRVKATKRSVRWGCWWDENAVQFQQGRDAAAIVVRAG
jgi:hypothetical protein